MAIDERTRIFYAKEFVRDFKKATKRHKQFPEDFDNFLNCLKIGQISDIATLKETPDGCRGFKVSKVRTFHCAELNRSHKHGYRIIYSEYRNTVLFLECYFKSKNEVEDKKRICRSLSSVKNHQCTGKFIEQNVPNSRFLLKKLEDIL